MSFFDKIKRIFTKSSSDDLFVPVEYKIRPHKENVTELSDNNEWIKEYLPEAYKRVIYTHHKNLCIGDYLIDDRTKNGAGEFKGELIQFGTEKFPDWNSVLKYIGV